jgi:voltage-gated potassium channel
LRGLRLAVVSVWRDPETKALPLMVGLLLLTGTIFYWTAEDWTLIQALSFSVVTLTTVGYGDLTPTSDYSRIFTIIYIFLGLGVFVAFVTSIAHHYTRQKIDVANRARSHLGAHSHHDPPPGEAGSQ